MSVGRRSTRRRFLKEAAGIVAAPYIVPAAALGAGSAVAPSGRLAVACIGVRNMGTNHLKSLLGSRRCQVVAICDVDSRVRKKALDRVAAKYGAKGKSGASSRADGYNDFRELLARDDVEAVTIATPDHTHALIAIAAMKAGKDVYVEKPMTLTIREGRAMADTARQYGRVLQCGSQRRSSSRVRRVCEMVRNGRIGRLVKVEVGCGSRPRRPQPWKPEPVPKGFDYDLWLGPAPWQPYTSRRCHYNFRFLADYSGGEMTNFGAHYLDVAQWGIGAGWAGPVEIEGKGDVHPTGLYDVFYRFHVEYTYANGVKLICTSRGGGTRFIGTEGWIRDNGSGEPAERFRFGLGPNELHLYEARGGHMGNFLECVRTRRDPSANVEIGHRSATVCHLGNIAMALQRKLEWDPAKEEFPGDDEANRMTWRPYREPWVL